MSSRAKIRGWSRFWGMISTIHYVHNETLCAFICQIQLRQTIDMGKTRLILQVRIDELKQQEKATKALKGEMASTQEKLNQEREAREKAELV